jgi:hypothetical protein
VSERNPGGGERETRRRDHERPVLPKSPRDDEVGWGDEPSERDDEWYRRERPPHHD